MTIENQSPRPLTDNALALRLANVSTASTSEATVCPFYGKITELRGVYSAAITGSNNTLTILKNGVDAGTTTPISTGTAAASTLVDHFNIPVKRGDVLAVSTSGDSTNTSILNMQLVVSGLTA